MIAIAIDRPLIVALIGLTIAVRFNPTGSIDTRNDGTYAAAANVAYSANTRYRFRVVINLAAHTYSVYVTPQAASEILIASNYAFRSEQANVSNLNTLATVVGVTGAVGSLNLCNINLSLPATPTPLPTATATPRPTATPPPTGQNYVISQAGTRNPSYPFPGSGGFADIRSGSLVPNSLYEAQLCDRLEN